MIDVVVVAFQSAAVLERCLAALSKVANVTSVVVVNHGTDASGAIARAGGATVIDDSSNPGYGAGQNRGRALGSAPYVLMLNPDAEIDAAGVAAGVAVLEAQPTVALVQGVIAGAGQPGPERSAGRALSPVHLWGRALGLRSLLRVGVVRRIARRLPALADHVDRAPTVAVDVEALAAVAVLGRRAALEAVRGFDEQRYFLYGEDMDLCRRLRNAGWRAVALPQAWAVHVSGASSSSNWARELEWWRGTLTYADTWWSPAARMSARGAAVVAGTRLALRHPRELRALVAALLR